MLSILNASQKSYLQTRPFSKLCACISICLLTSFTLLSNRNLIVNKSKSKLLVFYSKTHFVYCLLHLGQWQYILQSAQTKNLEVCFVSSLSLTLHVQTINKSFWLNLQYIFRIWPLLNTSTAIILVWITTISFLWITK